MARRTCHVHVGTGKTGTSAIQYALTKAHEYLLSCGYLYPDVSGNFEHVLNEKPTAGNAGVIGKALLESRGEQAFRLLRRLSERPENLVLSCEGFSNLPLPCLEEFVHGLNSLGYDVRCLVFFRPQAEMIVSSFLQHVKADKAGETTLDDHVERLFRSNSMEKRWNWYDRARKLNQAFGDNNVTVKWYPALTRRGSTGVVKATFDWLGVPLPDDRSAMYTRIINPTPGQEALMILQQLNSQGLGGKGFADKFLRRAYEGGVLGSKVTLRPSLVEMIESATRQSNVKLLERYCPELSGQDELKASLNHEQTEPIDKNKTERLMRIASDMLQSDGRTPVKHRKTLVKHGDTQMKVIELIEQMQQADPNLLNGIPENKAARLIQGVFKHMNNTLARTEEGVVNYPGFGRFRVRKVERDVDGKKVSRTQIVFRRAEPGGGKTADDAETDAC